MKSTLIISSYNRAHLLRRILISVSNQTCKLDRIIVADDGSKEDMGGVIQEEIHRFDYPISLVTQADEGFRLARSRNNAVRIADDGVLIFADQDMLFTKDYFSALLADAEERLFLIGYMLRLTEQQTHEITDELIESGDYAALIMDGQRRGSRRQYRLDRLYEWLYRLHLRAIGPKLRGGIFAANKQDIVKINGFDENYSGWGNEDDDLYWRLYASGVKGHNPQHQEYAIHQYHPVFRTVGKRDNKAYFHARRSEIMAGDWYCERGLHNEIDDYSDVKVTHYER